MQKQSMKKQTKFGENAWTVRPQRAQLPPVRSRMHARATLRVGHCGGLAVRVWTLTVACLYVFTGGDVREGQEKGGRAWFHDEGMCLLWMRRAGLGPGVGLE